MTVWSILNWLAWGLCAGLTAWIVRDVIRVELGKKK